MKCKTYIFKLTSGQLDDADLVTRLQATRHRLSCRHCRAFTRNDRRLDAILAGYQAHVLSPDSNPWHDGDTTVPGRAPAEDAGGADGVEGMDGRRPDDPTDRGGT